MPDAKTKLRELIQNSVGLSEPEKAEWLKVVEKLSDEQVQELATIFQKAEDQFSQISADHKQRVQAVDQQERDFLNDFKKKKIPELYAKAEALEEKSEEDQKVALLDELAKT